MNKALNFRLLPAAWGQLHWLLSITFPLHWSNNKLPSLGYLAKWRRHLVAIFETFQTFWMFDSCLSFKMNLCWPCWKCIVEYSATLIFASLESPNRIITFLETFCLLFEIVIQNVSDHFGANLVETQKPCTTLRVVSLFCIAFFGYSKNHLESISN